jgi:hypothetical protein
MRLASWFLFLAVQQRLEGHSVDRVDFESNARDVSHALALGSADPFDPDLVVLVDEVERASARQKRLSYSSASGGSFTSNKCTPGPPADTIQRGHILVVLPEDWRERGVLYVVRLVPNFKDPLAESIMAPELWRDVGYVIGSLTPTPPEGCAPAP